MSLQIVSLSLPMRKSKTPRNQLTRYIVHLKYGRNSFPIVRRRNARVSPSACLVSSSMDINENNTKELIDRAFSGDAESEQELFARTYAELKAIASKHLRAHRGQGATVQTTQVVHDAYLKLIGADTGGEPVSRAQFLAYMARIMRNLIIDHCRSRSSAKHGGDLVRLQWEDQQDAGTAHTADQWLMLHEALTRLTEKDTQTAEVVELKFFGGLSTEAVGEVLGVSRATVVRKWALGKAWLATELR